MLHMGSHSVPLFVYYTWVSRSLSLSLANDLSLSLSNNVNIRLSVSLAMPVLI